MKRVIFLFLALNLVASSFAQNTGTKVPTINNEFYEKSRKQKTAAWIFLAGGATLAISGVVIGTLEANLVREDENSVLGTIMVFTGLSAMVGSIPLFIAADKNKRKAITTSVSFRIEKATIIKPLLAYTNRYPAVAIQIRL
ncbi:MAG: hypothetical protein SFU21_16330 [Flavihumibacter sp.]|nr:hypothetical protein [Flavihumibacter sp.]